MGKESVVYDMARRWCRYAIINVDARLLRVTARPGPGLIQAKRA